MIVRVRARLRRLVALASGPSPIHPMRAHLLLTAALFAACSTAADRPASPVGPAASSSWAEPSGESLPATATSGVIPKTTRQLLTVVTEDWRATDGDLQRWQRTGAGWAEVGEPVPVVVGRSGLGWGIGLHGEGALGPDAEPGDPAKAEGDGRAPAGAFRLARAFGYADAEPTRLPYVAATPTAVCIDDAASPRYNTVFDAGRDPATLGVSLERMRRDDTLYRIGVIVDHNGGGELGTAPVPGAGSCIFLHVWRGPGTTTAGCTAMPDAALAEALGWLDAEAGPVLVQLPQPAYDRLAGGWELPSRGGEAGGR